jgi:bacillithiol system protein YtxJ
MGIFDVFKGGEKRNTGSSEGAKWIPLESRVQLDALIERSGQCPQLIFKNSTTCGISSIVRRTLEGNLAGLDGEADFFLLHVQYHRDLSDTIAQTFGVRHESPQLLVIKDGKLVGHASHGGISAIDLQGYL